MIGREFAAMITGSTETGLIQEAIFTFDPFRESEGIGHAPLVTISPAVLQYANLAHQTWSDNVTLLVTLFVRQPPNYDEQWFSDHLKSFDQMVYLLQNEERITAIESEQRYALDQSQNQARLLMQVTITVSHLP